MPTQEVISAFLDNEPFDANELAHALAEPGGRELLLDLMALRAVVQEDSAAGATPVVIRTAARQRRRWAAVGFAAATLLFGVGSILAVKALRPGTSSPSAEADVPPRPDRVVTFEPGLEWHDVIR
jgi:hypothetical protein